MLDKNQWLAIGLLSGFAYILGKDRESFDAESFNPHVIKTVQKSIVKGNKIHSFIKT